MTVNEHRAIEDVVQAENQCEDRRLAGAGRSDQRRPLARLDGERDVPQHAVVAVVAESHMR